MVCLDPSIGPFYTHAEVALFLARRGQPGVEAANGRLFPLGWIKAKRAARKIDVVTFKMLGVLEEYRRRGIDALLYLEVVKAVYEGDIDGWTVR